MHVITGYHLVFYDQDLPRTPEKAMRKTVTASEFKTLQEDIFTGVELNEIPYTITERCWFDMACMGNITMVMVLTVKRGTV